MYNVYDLTITSIAQLFHLAAYNNLALHYTLYKEIVDSVMLGNEQLNYTEFGYQSPGARIHCRCAVVFQSYRLSSHILKVSDSLLLSLW